MKQLFQNRLEELQKLVNQTNKSSVLIIQQLPNNIKQTIFPHLRESISNIICFVQVAEINDIEMIFRKSSDIIDYFLLDCGSVRPDSHKIIKESKLLSQKYNKKLMLYNDIKVWAQAAVNYVFEMENLLYKGKNILLIGNTYLSTNLIIELLNKGITIHVMKEDYEEGFYNLDQETRIQFKSDLIKVISNDDNATIEDIDIILGSSMMTLYPSIDNLKNVTATSIYDIGLGNFSVEFISKHKPNTTFYRSDDRSGISSVVIGLLETNHLISECLGRVNINDISLISGGIIGNIGDIVVDNINNPTFILGVANGYGGFKSKLSNKEQENLIAITNLISDEI